MASQKSRLDFDLTLHNTNGTSEGSSSFWRPEKRERKRREVKDEIQKGREREAEKRKGNWSHIA